MDSTKALNRKSIALSFLISPTVVGVAYVIVKWIRNGDVAEAVAIAITAIALGFLGCLIALALIKK